MRSVIELPTLRCPLPVMAGSPPSHVLQFSAWCSVRPLLLDTAICLVHLGSKPELPFPCNLRAANRSCWCLLLQTDHELQHSVLT